MIETLKSLSVRYHDWRVEHELLFGIAAFALVIVCLGIAVIADWVESKRKK